MFNWLTVLILLPLEAASGYLFHLTSPMVRNLGDVKDSEKPKFLKVITDPLTNYIVAVSNQHLLAFFAKFSLVYANMLYHIRQTAAWWLTVLRQLWKVISFLLR